ncbi:Myb-like domain [Sesbania bispinosa]|nr:Myb-like domain [Sesbania bispinosa]
MTVACLTRGAYPTKTNDGVDLEGLLPTEDVASSNGAEGDLSVTEDSDEFWKAFIESSALRKSIKSNNGYAPQKEKSQVKNDGSEDAEECKSENTSSTEAKSSTSVKRRNKWKEEEVKKLIGMRWELNDRFQVVKGRMGLWEEISQTLLANGISRNPGQCKSMWTSLVQKYEEVKNEKDGKKSWPYLEDMERILSDNEALAKK